MKDILKSKVMVCFILFIIAICSFNTININNEMHMERIGDNSTVVLNKK